MQFVDELEDMILAGLLFFALKNPSHDLTKIAFDYRKLKDELIAFVSEEGGNTTITCQERSQSFCRSTKKKVKMHCLCQTSWIEGETAKAIYGSKVKEYNAHKCCECGNWFHHHCLKECCISVPKRTHDFLCPYCKKIPVIPWGHRRYTNTCTIDNFLQIVIVMCLQINDLPKWFGNSDSELVLKACVAKMIKGDIFAGKELLLDHLNSVIGFPMEDSTFNCYGSEYAYCLTIFSNVWKVHLSLHCCSPSCPRTETVRFPCGFNLQPQREGESYIDQIQNQFPGPDSILSGYCGAEFKDKPPQHCTQFEISTKVDVECGNELTMSVCSGTLLVKEASFMAKSPWLVPFSITSLSGKSLLMLPMTITIYRNNYLLGGFSMHRPGHYTSVVVWRGDKYYYDGLSELFIPLRDEHLQQQQGSFAYYILDPKSFSQGSYLFEFCFNHY